MTKNKKPKLTIMNRANEWVRIIDERYRVGREKKLSRLSIEWGKWSRKFNIKLKDLTAKSSGADEVVLKYVFLYWVNRSQLLEAHYKTKLGKRSLKKKLRKEGKELKELISKGETTLKITEDELLMRVLGQ